METQDTITATLAERGARYGDFTDHARICQAIKTTMQYEAGCVGWNRLNDVQKQALEVIADKIARILSGDPNYDDNWRDIQGYARLVEERLPGSKLQQTTCSEVDVPSGWHRWDGAAVTKDANPPGVDPKAYARVLRRDGAVTEHRRIDSFAWWHDGKDADIVAYQLATESCEASDWYNWDGKYEIPKNLGSNVLVEVRRRDGGTTRGISGSFNWAYTSADAVGAIMAWRKI